MSINFGSDGVNRNIAINIALYIAARPDLYYNHSKRSTARLRAIVETERRRKHGGLNAPENGAMPRP
jgi:hypothetical protein